MTAAETLAEWNAAEAPRAAETILPCCGSLEWAHAMAARRPFSDATHLLAAASAEWSALPAPAWQEAFNSHPRIGEKKAAAAHAKSAAWSTTEQAHAQADVTLADALATANASYEQHFNRIFLICANGRSASDILAEMNRRMANNDAAELREAVEQQRQITQLRLQRWLAEGL